MKKLMPADFISCNRDWVIWLGGGGHSAPTGNWSWERIGVRLTVRPGGIAGPMGSGGGLANATPDDLET
jgi:hypothetical protein